MKSTRKSQQNTAPNETEAASKYLFTELHHVTIFYLCFSLLQLGERERGHGHGRDHGRMNQPIELVESSVNIIIKKKAKTVLTSKSKKMKNSERETNAYGGCKIFLCQNDDHIPECIRSLVHFYGLDFAFDLTISPNLDEKVSDNFIYMYSEANVFIFILIQQIKQILIDSINDQIENQALYVEDIDLPDLPYIWDNSIREDFFTSIEIIKGIIPLSLYFWNERYSVYHEINIALGITKNVLKEQYGKEKFITTKKPPTDKNIMIQKD
ncbi:hypothetical protein RhiirA4_548242 [Rhizophagus irregularis]|uniref:Uncharacterized protein n=1 Tax=Rhizophagus irregularis TaxID=588596 RepID=A0A2I1H6J4_9GLOM|nr:hypothetical protein RhiirA4_548242 [Rhizophagus irregularis]